MSYLPPYTAEYRRTCCVQCGRPLAEHRRYTAEDVAKSAGATWQRPVNGNPSPLSPKVIGQWVGHAPMPWSKENGGPQ